MSYKQILSLVLVGAVAFAVGFSLAFRLVGDSSRGAIGPGPTHYQKENFIQGFSGGRTGQLDVSNTGVLQLASALNASGTVIVQGAITLRSSLTADGTSVTSSFSHNFGGTTSTIGLVLRSADGTCAVLGIDNGGQITTSTASCP